MRRENIKLPANSLEETAFKVVDVRPSDIRPPSPAMKKVIEGNHAVIAAHGVNVEDFVKHVREKFSTQK